MSTRPSNDRMTAEAMGARTDRRRFLLAGAVAGAVLPAGVPSWASSAAAQSAGAITKRK